MNDLSKMLLAYTMDFASFLASSLSREQFANIKSVVVFGSVSRGEAEKGSDIDVFIDVIRQDSIEKKVAGILKDFYETEIFRRWKLKGIENKINCITGNLDSWKELRISVLANGIAIYSKYAGRSNGKQYVIIYWNAIKSASKRVQLSKKLYGYRQKTAYYKGMIELTGSIKLGPNCMLSPLESAKAVIDVIRNSGTAARTIYVQRIDDVG
ncbi:MAG: nucleotidyltransferase domain-containing protein [Candidatus Aenigmarchaeota archaeon]|nr:nucleotidyltransferase domain-containing protein [Candidatus Aenigmarchaeota archaeon]